MNINFKKLTLSGMLAVSSFSGTITHSIDKERLAYFAGGVCMLPITTIACYVSYLSFVPFCMLAADDPRNTWYHQCAVMLAYAAFCVPAASLTYTNYILFERALSSPQDTQKHVQNAENIDGIADADGNQKQTP